MRSLFPSPRDRRGGGGRVWRRAGEECGEGGAVRESEDSVMHREDCSLLRPCVGFVHERLGEGTAGRAAGRAARASCESEDGVMHQGDRAL